MCIRDSGMSVALLGFDTKMFKDAITEKFAKKSQEIIDKNLAAFDDGHSLVMEKLGDVEIEMCIRDRCNCWYRT